MISKRRKKKIRNNISPHVGSCYLPAANLNMSPLLIYMFSNNLIFHCI